MIETWVSLKGIAFRVLKTSSDMQVPCQKLSQAIHLRGPTSTLGKSGNEARQRLYRPHASVVPIMTSSVTAFPFSNNGNQTWKITITQNQLLFQTHLSHL